MKRFVVLALVASSFVVVPAVAAKSPLTADITSVSTQWLTRSRDLTLHITYSTTDFHRTVSVTTSYSTTALAGRSQVPLVLKNESLPTLKTLSTDNAIDIDAGTHDLEVRISHDDLKLSDSGAYLFHFDIKADDSKASLNLVMPVISTTRFSAPLNVVVLWPVTNAPVMNADHSFITEAPSFESGSPAFELVNGANTNVTLLTDPDLIQTAQETGAEDWLNAINNKASATENFTLSFANADLAGLSQLGLDSALNTSTVAGGPKSMLYIPKTGDILAKTWKKFASDGAVIAVSDKCYPSSSSMYTASGIYDNSTTGNKALVIDSQMSNFMRGAVSSSPGSVIQQQALLADSLITQQERPTQNRVLVLAPNFSNLDVSATGIANTLAGLNNSWLRHVTVQQALTNVSGSRIHKGCATSSLAKSTRAQLAASETARLRMATLIDGTVEEHQLLEAMLRTSSMNSNKARLAALNKNLKSTTTEIYNAVRILSSGAVVLSQEQGKVPITIHNSLSVPVRVLIEAVGEPSVRVIPSPMQVLEIPAGKRRSIEIPTRFIGSDVGFLRLQLTDEVGKPIGTAVRIQLSSAAYAQIAQWVMGVAAALLAILLFRNFYRRFRKHPRQN